MFNVLTAALVLIGGCDRSFVNVGGNHGVPIDSVLKYAQDHDLSFDEARYLMGRKYTESAGRESGLLRFAADEQGVSVSGAKLQATATRCSYDQSDQRLVLEGAANAPATLVKDGASRVELSADRITYWLDDGRFKVEGAGW